MQYWNTLIKAFMKEYYSLGKLKACVIRLPPLFNILRKLSRRHSSASMSTLRWFHITSS
jgi:hypothetical protein